MLLSRWKLMAGVLGVSLGGLAAVAGQCPKSDTKTSTRRQAEPPEAEVPLLPPVPSGGTPSAKAPALPAAPALPPAPGSVDLPPPPASSELPALPATPPAPAAAKPVEAPTLPPAPPVVPASGTEVKPLPPAPEPAPAAKPEPVAKPTPPAVPDAPAVKAVPPAAPPAADPVIEPKPEPKPEVKPAAATVTPPVAAAAAASKYRILLRVGEGEPTFEVKCGDDLVLKVVCEKIDIKSPEKGSGPSAVKASGKVRFVGFGAEGTCEELAFLAGTGEVALAGAVKIQVKDKLGRVESELSTETMKYRIDPSAAFTGGKP